MSNDHDQNPYSPPQTECDAPLSSDEQARKKADSNSEQALGLLLTGLIGLMAPALAIYGILFLFFHPYPFPRKSLAYVGTALHCLWSVVWAFWFWRGFPA